MSVRVYLEDTDAGGIVYHASYLRFMERARSDWLRAAGIGLDDWQRRHGVLFAVRSIAVDYLGAAKLDDRLDVSVSMLTLKRASLVCEQFVQRDERTLTRASVQLACLDAHSVSSARASPVAIPPAIREAMTA